MATLSHPGAFVKEHVLPAGMSVTKAAERLQISRPALSNFLNGKADLSPEMASRIEAAFGVPARKLLDIQSEWDASRAPRDKLAPIIKSYVPPFLQIRSAQIEAWAGSGIRPRQRLAVFIRTLVNSTGVSVSLSSFPGNDDSELAGWDGEVVADAATPWIPEGRSGWEFGVSEDPKRKADKDFAKSVKAIDQAERMAMTFVFVTPRSWAGKNAWVEQHKAKNLWKDVRAYNASDLEQWLDQSIAGQVWFAAETAQDAAGTISLDEAWKIWAADCEPELSPALFADAVARFGPTLRQALTADTYNPLIIAADSRDEALAFLSAAMSADNPELGVYRDRIVIFREPGALNKLAAKVSNFIPVIISREVEKELAPFRTSMPSFIIYPKNAAPADAGISLETLSFDAFNTALQAMELSRDEVDRLARETGRSPTVLRRRLSKLPAVRAPDWSIDPTFAAHLAPFIFAGAWKVDNTADQHMLSALAGNVSFEELERRLPAMLLLDSAPVWAGGSFRGVTSKIDLLFAIKDSVSGADLEQFFVVAELVLGEDDPALDLPAEDQWKAGIYGKKREISGALRDGLAETMVLLSVHGDALFRPRLNFDAASRSAALVRSILALPLSGRTLEAQADNLPLYAEAAPDTFLRIIEGDLSSPASAALSLMRPVSDYPFARASRTGLIWALEGLGWAPEYFMRTVLALARLGEKVIEDNLVNKPTGSLSAIFRCWMPQTSVGLEGRKAALTKLVAEFPAVAWPICVQQFAAHSGVGHYNHKPKWRLDGYGFGHPVTRGEMNAFALHAFQLARDWPSHSRDTIGDIVSNMAGLDEDLKQQAWDVVDQWANAANEADRAWVRETIRVTQLTRRAAMQRQRQSECRSDERAREIYDRLEAADPVLRNEWLFRQSWVEESLGEFQDNDFDFQQRDARITQLRENAVQDVFAARGVSGLVELADHGQASSNVGWSLAAVQDGTLIHSLVELVKGGDLTGSRAGILSGALHKAKQREAVILAPLLSLISPENIVPVLVLAPFDRVTWTLVEGLETSIQNQYWQTINPGWNRDDDDITHAVKQLMAAGRPRAAFLFAHFDLKKLPARLVFDLMSVMVQSEEPSDSYMLSQHHLQEAFKIMNASGELNEDELAGLEFAYIEAFAHGRGHLVNLERQIAARPDLFVQAVAFVFKRDDGGTDPPELQLVDQEMRQARASACYTLLESITLIPGCRDGVIDPKALIAWLDAARSQLATLARIDVGDQMIGKLLSHAPEAEDGVWPCLPVRDVLEQIATEQIQIGIRVALANARGVHWRGEGGAQERELAAKYRGWADAMEFTHPRVAAIMRGLERSYLHQAEWEDNDARVARRIRS